MRRTWIVLLAVQLTACSFVFVQGPPPGQPAKEIESKGKDKFECTSSRTVPWIDAVGSGLWALNFLLAFTTDKPFPQYVSLPLYGAAGLVQGYATYTGFKKTGECRRAHEEAIKAGAEEPPPEPPPPSPGTMTVPTAPL
jgi:hypothetical protein